VVGLTRVLGNMYKKYFLYLALGLVVTLASCSSDNEVVEQDFGYDYFPLEIGNFREYKVTEVNFLTSGPDTSRFFLRETIIDSLVNQDITTFVLERASRSSMNDEWVVDSLWTARITEREAIQVENNVPILKIQFPVESNRSWDSNLFNTKQEETYESVLIDSDTLDSPVLRVIIEETPDNIVEEDDRDEFYARGIGLISRDFVSLKFCTTNCANVMEIESGRVLDQKLINHGKN